MRRRTKPGTNGRPPADAAPARPRRSPRKRPAPDPVEELLRAVLTQTDDRAVADWAAVLLEGADEASGGTGG